MPQPPLIAMLPGCEITLSVSDYDLAATITSGQVFAWQPDNDNAWTGVVGGRWVKLRACADGIAATTAIPQSEWSWLTDFLQSEVNLPKILNTFPANDPNLAAAVAECHGLRLLRQEPWECLASFILSSTKQIAQIRQIVALLCQRYGSPVAVPVGHPPAFAFPTPTRIAALSESDLRGCKMGFRAKYLHAAAERIATGELLENIRPLPLAAARAELMKLAGVGEKIADCVLLFAYGFPDAFPVDVWVARAVRHYYFRGKCKTLPQMRRFVVRHFGPNAGYAQQYLFHHIRTKTH